LSRALVDGRRCVLPDRNSSPLRWLRSPAVLAATALIIVQGVLLSSAIRPEFIPSTQPLSGFPTALGQWNLQEEGLVDADTQRILNADDVLNRLYTDGSTSVNLFVAAFRSQRNGKAPHSPKNCLPGSGWAPVRSDEYNVAMGAGSSITVNRYVVAYGETQSLVMYWYQSRDRAVASEYKAKFWVVADAMRLNRTDTALIRVIVPIVDRDDEAATKTAVRFVQTFFPALRAHLPT
jgi:EpsI family protein